MVWDRSKKSKSGSLNSNPTNNGSQNGPLRKIAKILHCQEGFLGRDTVVFECGHEGKTTPRAKRGRCAQCKAEGKT